jgi:hypothetical protein
MSGFIVGILSLSLVIRAIVGFGGFVAFPARQVVGLLTTFVASNDGTRNGVRGICGFQDHGITG